MSRISPLVAVDVRERVGEDVALPDVCAVARLPAEATAVMPLVVLMLLLRE